MKMPETIHVGVNTIDADFVNPADVRVADATFDGPHSKPDAAARGTAGGSGFIAEYRFVRLLEVTQLVPPPVIEVKEVVAH